MIDSRVVMSVKIESQRVHRDRAGGEEPTEVKGQFKDFDKFKRFVPFLIVSR